MKKKILFLFFLGVIYFLFVTSGIKGDFDKNIKAKPEFQWKIHDMDRPLPPVVTPGVIVTPGQPPSDSIVLFDGKV
ncbi:hypothetical protein KA005_67150, partial [bacterium]|nr:hypothetical protein [bacterium]